MTDRELLELAAKAAGHAMIRLLRNAILFGIVAGLAGVGAIAVIYTVAVQFGLVPT